MDLNETHGNFPSRLMYIGFKKNHGLKGYIASACFNLLQLFYDFG